MPKREHTYDTHVPDEREQQDRLAPELVRQLAEDRREHELHQREDGNQRAEEQVALVERPAVREQEEGRVRVREQLRNDRDQDADAEHVQEDGQEDDG